MITIYIYKRKNPWFCYILLSIIVIKYWSIVTWIFFKMKLLQTSLKLVSAIIYQIFVFHQMIPLSLSFFRSQDISIFVFRCSPLFLPVSYYFKGWYKINLKVYDIIKCLNKNLTKHFVCYLGKEKRYDIETLFIDRVLNKELFYGKRMQKMCSNS